MPTIHEAADAIQAGRLTPVDLVEECLEQIERWEDKVRAWVFVDREGARAEARRLTEELRRGEYRGPLHGIPLGVKDIIDVADWPTAAGFRPWANAIAREDAEVIRPLRQRGAILLGKTVTTQFASFDPPVTRNPWNFERTPGGSSSGSAAAVATGMCLGALGSQTGGSLTRPASYCGVATCKPTYRWVSTRGVVPLAPALDHVGPIAGDTLSLALLLQAMVHYESPLRADLSRACAKPVEFTLLRARGFFEELAEPAVREAFDEVCDRLRRTFPLEEVVLPVEFDEVLSRHRTIMAVEAAQQHARRLQRHARDYEPRIRELIEEGQACSASRYLECMEHRDRLRLALEPFLSGRVLITPATTSPAPSRDSTGNPAFNSPWSYVGDPTISIPIGLSPEGLPLGIQFITSWAGQPLLFSAAAACERALAVGPLKPAPPT